MRTQPPVEPKPYLLVAIPRRAPERSRLQDVGEEIGHHRFAGYTCRLDLTLEVESDYLFVGSGDYEFDPGAGGRGPDVWHTFFRRGGQVCIPGSSLKGAVRSLLEAVSNSCVLQRARGERVPDSHRRCGEEDDTKDRLCPACRLFGAAGFRGRVSFSDAFLVQGGLERVKVAELWSPRRYDERARRFYQVKGFAAPRDVRRPQRNYRFVEAAPKGACFQGRLLLENLSEGEVGLVCLALGWGEEEGRRVQTFLPKVGGAKPRCFGAVRFLPWRLTLWGGLQGLLRPEVLEGEHLEGFLARCIARARDEGLVNEASWHQLVQGLRRQPGQCPGGNY